MDGGWIEKNEKNRWMVGWIEKMDGWMDKKRWMVGWIEKRKKRWMVGWINI